MIGISIVVAIESAQKVFAEQLPWATGPAILFKQSTDPARKVGSVSTISPKARRRAQGDPAVNYHIYDPSDLEIMREAAAEPPKPLDDVTIALRSASHSVEGGDDIGAEKVLFASWLRHPKDDQLSLFLAEQMVKHGDWNGAKNVILSPDKVTVETNFKWLKAAILAHLGYVFDGERDALISAVRSDRGYTPKLLAQFPDNSPRDVEALAWVLGGASLYGSGPQGREARALGYASHFATMYPDDPLNLSVEVYCLNFLGRFSETVQLLEPYAQSRDSDVQNVLRGPYELAFRNSRNAKP